MNKKIVFYFYFLTFRFNYNTRRGITLQVHCFTKIMKLTFITSIRYKSSICSKRFFSKWFFINAFELKTAQYYLWPMRTKRDQYPKCCYCIHLTVSILLYYQIIMLIYVWFSLTRKRLCLFYIYITTNIVP